MCCGCSERSPSPAWEFWFLSAGGALSNRLQQLGYSGANVSAAAGVVGGTVLAFAVVILVISFIGIWSGAAMGRLTTGPRVTGIVLASLGLLLGIVSALGSARTTVHVTTGPSFRGSPIPGIIIIVVNLLIIWALGFSGKTRAAFRSLPPPTGYPAMAPAGYGPPRRTDSRVPQTPSRRLRRHRHRPTHPRMARTSSPRRHPRRSRRAAVMVTPKLGPATPARATAAI